MAKKGKKRRRNRNRGGGAPQVRKFAGLYLVPHPLQGVDRDKLMAAALAMGKRAEAEFAGRLGAVQEIVNRCSPPQLLSQLMVYGLTVFMDDKGKASQHRHAEEFDQAHIEIVQALALQRDWRKEDRPTPDPNDDVGKLFKQLPELAKCFSDRRHAALREDLSDEEKAVHLLQEYLRLHTQAVRNWGYFSAVVKTVAELVTPLDDLAKAEVGFPLSAYGHLFEALTARVQKALQERPHQLRSLLKKKAQVERIAKLFELFPGSKAGRHAFEKYLEGAQLSDKEFFMAGLLYTDTLLPLDFIVSMTDVAGEMGGNMEAAKKLLDKIAIQPGGLAGLDPDHVFLSNPVWTRPLIEVQPDMYMAPLPQAFFSFAFPILGEVVSGSPKLAKAFEERRAEFLEAEIERIFSAAFPDTQVVRGYKWRDGVQGFENDLVVLVDSHLIVVEAKSGSISWPALRGAPDRARRHFQEIVIAPSVQSLRLQQAVEEVVANPAIAATKLPSFPFDLNRIKRVLRLSVSLEDFATVQTNTSMAVEAGWVPADHTLAPAMTLADLEVVFTILGSKAERIHYLKRRAEIGQYSGDEIDLLGVYIANGFDLDGMDGANMEMHVTGMSTPIDEYCQARDLGLDVKKPERRLTPWWRAICNTIEGRDFARWSEAATILLDINEEKQRKIEGKFEKLKRQIEMSWRDPAHKSSIVLIPPAPRTDAVVVYGFKSEEAENRHKVIEGLAAQVFGDDHPHVQVCLVIAVNIDAPGVSYSTMAVLNRPSGDP